jgi:hypothetical protein
VSETCAHYQITSGGGSYSLGGGESRTVTVRFEPESAGTKTCTIQTGSSCSNVSCTGVGVEAPECSVSPTSLDFGEVEVASHLDRTFTIENVGGGTLMGSVSETCAHYQITSGGGSYSLGGGESRTVTVRFTGPSSPGTYTCTVETGTACPNVVCTAVVPGEGPECSVSPTSLDFGMVNPGENVDRTFTIENVGGGTLMGSVSETCAHYQITSGGGSYSLGGGQSRTVTVRFTGTSSPGTYTCTVETGSSCTDVSCSAEVPEAD